MAAVSSQFLKHFLLQRNSVVFLVYCTDDLFNFIWFNDVSPHIYWLMLLISPLSYFFNLFAIITLKFFHFFRHTISHTFNLFKLDKNKILSRPKLFVQNMQNFKARLHPRLHRLCRLLLRPFFRTQTSRSYFLASDLNIRGSILARRLSRRGIDFLIPRNCRAAINTT